MKIYVENTGISLPPKRNRTTFLGYIDASGKYIKPMIVNKRKTFGIDLVQNGILPEDLMLAQSEIDFITTPVFERWPPYI